MNTKAKINILQKLVEWGVISHNEEVVPSPRLFKAYVNAFKALNRKKVIKNKKGEWIYTYKLFVRDIVEFNKLNKHKSPVKFCYVITNPAWPGLAKVGISDQPHRRLAQYQTYSPKRDYVLHHWSPHNNAAEIEKLIISELGNEALAEGEWVPVSKLEELFKKLNSLAFNLELQTVIQDLITKNQTTAG